MARVERPWCCAGVRKWQGCLTRCSIALMLTARNPGKAVPAWNEVSRRQRLATVELWRTCVSCSSLSGSGRNCVSWQ